MQINFASNLKFRSLSGDLQIPNGGNIPETEDGGYNNLTLGGTTNSDFDFAVNGNFVNTGTFSSSNGRTVTFSGSSQQDVSGINTFYNLTLNNAAGLGFVNGTDTIREVLKTDNGSFTNVGAQVIASYSIVKQPN